MKSKTLLLLSFFLLFLLQACGGGKQRAVTLNSCINQSIQPYLSKGWKIVSSSTRNVSCGWSPMLGREKRGSVTEYILSK